VDISLDRFRALLAEAAAIAHTKANGA